MNLEAIYQNLCLSADPARALERMGDTTLAAMARHLEAGGITAGIPAVVLGLVENEIVSRWVAEHSNLSPVGQG